MKKRIIKAGIILMSLLVATMVMTGCKVKETTKENEAQKDAPTEHQFDATVSEVAEDYIVVVALPDQTIVDEVKVWTGLLSGEEMPEMEVDATVRITHNGRMTMSIPPQMSAVAIEVIEQ